MVCPRVGGLCGVLSRHQVVSRDLKCEGPGAARSGTIVAVVACYRGTMSKTRVMILTAVVGVVLVGCAPSALAQPSPPPPTSPVADAGPPDGQPPVIVEPGDGVVTPAPGTLPDEVTTDPVGFARWIYDALRGGQWRLVVAGALAALMVGLTRLRLRLFGATDRGRAVAVMTLSLLGALVSALAGVVPMSVQLFVGAVTVALTAVGGRQWLSRLLWPKDGGAQWLTWLRPWLGVES